MGGVGVEEAAAVRAEVLDRLLRGDRPTLDHLLDAGDGNYICETQGIEAHTYSGWRRVKTVSFHEVKEKRKYKVTLNNGVSFIASEDHSLMVARQQKKPGELTVGTRLDSVKPLLPEGQG